ncbi:MAG: hypothetical protein EBU12_07525 [Microbacteriaceae bacterium]|nr:hypothetical protein [Microbacteriaceae bacterium]
MAAPNIVAVTTITGKTIGAAVTTSLTAVLTNSSSSNKVFKINSIVAANIDGVNNADLTVSIYKNATTDYYLASTISVPADTTLVVSSKDSSFYLEENDSIRALANANGDIHIIISYEEIS